MRTRNKWIAGGAAAAAVSVGLFANSLRGGDAEPQSAPETPAATSSAPSPTTIAVGETVCKRVVAELNPGPKGGDDTPAFVYPQLEPELKKGPQAVVVEYTPLDPSGEPFKESETYDNTGRSDNKVPVSLISQDGIMEVTVGVGGNTDPIACVPFLVRLDYDALGGGAEGAISTIEVAEARAIGLLPGGTPSPSAS